MGKVKTELSFDGKLCEKYFLTKIIEIC